ncbi:Monooxygenase FAD-binding [Penicillium longicatenatum]|uniref:Monooxygenase FAD-binding n=1 Tax=Penicillium longicatenatum TaxID=1561947 RepID=UPI002549AD3E|nr:Monooxygenase FAD-binding [Penicillium longicatenatum]KAJ5658851.1 Monooxygenase FAD-binding [Penicillium longicatenatum]
MLAKMDSKCPDPKVFKGSSFPTSLTGDLGMGKSGLRIKESIGTDFSVDYHKKFNFPNTAYTLFDQGFRFSARSGVAINSRTVSCVEKQRTSLRRPDHLYVLDGRKPEYYDPLYLPRALKGSTFVLILPDRFNYSACNDTSQLLKSISQAVGSLHG